MRRNCNLELSLSPSSDYNAVQQLPTSDHSSEESRRQQQQLTIFYDGKIVSSDVTEIQARAIILLASQERTKKTTRSLASSPLLLQKQLYSPNALSMKGSLQRFLQKRKNRVQSTSPYHR
ncbi:PREDICTED: protein TIFY 5A-like isoform X2 [Ipomoea nil]|uniref:protein TIFY 5A-like isoform X2 n=1 Tax=Ipomoea nil TaxID=35883 RepID=UPI000900C264|nr:PREDICTED: protein TIFY 5A-like isoform X2 [Ipomoea nil]